MKQLLISYAYIFFAFLVSYGTTATIAYAGHSNKHFGFTMSKGQHGGWTGIDNFNKFKDKSSLYRKDNRNITKQTQSIPEPSTLLLIGAGLAVFAGFRKKIIKRPQK